MHSGRIETCSNRIKEALSLKGINQTELCKRAKVPKSSLSLYLSGAYEPRQDRLYDMARVLGVDPVWLMGYDVPMNKQETPPNDEHKLTEGEKILLDLFNRVPEDKQQLVLQMIRAVSGNQEQ